jgi:predicted Fe-Mo cluster-binding NifX family protein
MNTIAFPVQGLHMASIMDFSSWLHILQENTVRDGGVKLFVQWLSPQEKVNALLQASVSTVICGCISDSMYRMLDRAGIQVIWGITGPITTVVKAFTSGSLNDSKYRVVGLGEKYFRPFEPGQWCLNAEATQDRAKEGAMAFLPS